jgi:hypothetical protein
MMGHAHLHHLGAGPLPHLPHGRDRVRVAMVQGRQDHAPFLKQVGEGGLHSALFRPGNGVPRHETLRHGAEGRLRRGHHAALGAAHIGDDRIRRDMAGNGAHHDFHGAQGHGQDNHIRIIHRTRRVALIAIDDADFLRAPQMHRIAAAPHHLGAIPRLFQRPRQRTADQTHADNA